MSSPTSDTVGIDALLAALGDALNVTERCALCPWWSWTGPPEEARRRFERHRLGKRHRDKVSSRESLSRAA